jgi:tetratricopeptide (TPR) repeat protein
MFASKVRAGLFLLASLGALAPLSARAAEPDKTVELRFKEGVAHARAGDYEAALQSFQQAYAIKPVPRLLYNMAVCEEKLERWVDAIHRYHAVLDDPSTSDQDRADARAHIAALEGKVGHIEVHAADGAGIAIDDGPVVATAPITQPLLVAPGHHVVVIRLPAGVQSTPIDPRPGETVRLELAFQAAPPQLAPTPLHTPEVPTPRPTQGPGVARIAVSGSLAVLGLVAGAAAIVVGANSATESDRANRLRQQLGATNGNNSFCAGNSGAACNELAADNNSASSDKTTAIVLGIGSAALLGAGVATWFLWPKPRSEAVSIAPMVGRDRVGASLVFIF